MSPFIVNLTSINEEGDSLRYEKQSGVQKQQNRIFAGIIAVILLMILAVVVSEYGLRLPNWVFWIIPVSGLILYIPLFLLMAKHPYEVAFPWQTGQLYGAHRYEIKQDRMNDFIEKTKKSIIDEGYTHVGGIRNSFNASMEVYIHDPDLRRETILLIQTKCVTMSMLLEHRGLFADFILQYSGKEDLRDIGWMRWQKRLHTVICVDRMSSPLQILLSALAIHTYSEPERKMFAPVYALIGQEKKLYTKAFKPGVFLDDITPWLKKHILGNELYEYEHIWKGLDWQDVFFMDWRKKKPQKVNRYTTMDNERESFLSHIKETLLADQYRHIGSVCNTYESAMDVYNLEKEDSEVTVLVIETDTITEELFLEHRYLLNSFMEKHRGDEAGRWQEGIRMIIGVRKMTTELQILLCSQLEYKKPKIYYEKPNSAEVPQVFALVEEEKSFYSMTYTPGDFKYEMQHWLNKHIPGIDGGAPEIVWDGLEWEDLERLPVSKEEMIVKVHKALNVWKGGYKEQND